MRNLGGAHGSCSFPLGSVSKRMRKVAFAVRSFSCPPGFRPFLSGSVTEPTGNVAFPARHGSLLVRREPERTRNVSFLVRFGAFPRGHVALRARHGSKRRRKVSRRAGNGLERARHVAFPVHPDVSDAMSGQFGFQRFAIEVRHAARHGEGADVHQGPDTMCLERSHEFVEGTRGVPDGVDRRH